MRRRTLGSLALVVLALLWLGLGAAPAAAGPGERHTVRLEASQYRFEPGVIQVSPGDRVTIELVATDVVHGLYLDGYELQMTADPGQTARLTFVADRSGSFRFRCSVTCGAMHPFMIGKLRVGGNRLLASGAALLALVAAGGLFLGRKEA
jgi:heme/copper-type cytochrome/quinol oxidase subunit 2